MTSTTPFSEIAKLGPPANDEIEVCFFGPSFGECILVHVGSNRWIVVDSCIYAGMDQPIAVYYLEQLGLDPTVIESILVTHWHDDHSRGAAKLVESIPDATIWIAQTLTTREFLRFATRMQKNNTAVAGSRLNEFLAIINAIKERRRQGRQTFGFAQQRMPLHQINGSALAHGSAVKFTALSPSHGDQFDFLQRIAEILPRARQPKRSLGGPSPNEISVASLLEIGPCSILLGADLENAKAGSGWSAVLDSNKASRFGAHAQIYKIPHHGSLTAHNPSVWSEMLTKDPIAVLTPWRKGRGRLPDEDGIKAITNLCKDAFSTSRDAAARPKVRSPAVQSYLRSNRIQVRSLGTAAGFVRMRRKPGDDWRLELFAPACHLGELVRRRNRTTPR